MKKLLFLILLFGQQAMAQNGIKFEQGTWNQILSKARAENKIVFLDAYTTWCGPCKWMSANTFTNANVGSFFNKNYVNAKIDMEKGEGINLAERYNVTAYPTLLFIDGNGKLLHKAVGAQDADQFLVTGRDALNPDKQFYTLKEKYSKNSLTTRQLAELAKAAYALEDPSTESYISAYLRQQSSWFNRETLLFLFDVTSVNDRNRFDFLMQNESKIKNHIGADTVNSYLNSFAKSIATEVADNENKTETAVLKFEETFLKYRPDQKEAKSQSLDYGMTRANNEGNANLAHSYIVEFVNLNLNILSSDDLNSIAWSFYEKVTDKNHLRQALKWALKSVELQSKFHNNDTVAHLYYILGDNTNAKKYADIALRLGKAAGENVKITEDLLKIINIQLTERAP